jgi:SAM-dependent methyltransferase
MPKEDWQNSAVHKVLEKDGLWEFKNGEIQTVLDVACGLSLKSKFLAPPVIVGVDIHEPYLRAIESDVPYAVVKCDVRNIQDVFIDDSFDVVYAFDIIEHLEKEESLNLIKACKSIAKRAVVVETPKGYIPQNIDIQGFDADHWQTHRCGWEVFELEELGFQCTVRDYVMQDIQRHTETTVCPEIQLIDGIYVK